MMLQRRQVYVEVYEMGKKYNKDWYKSKTLWINGLAIIGGIATAISIDLASGSVLTIASVVNIILRIVTKTDLKVV